MKTVIKLLLALAVLLSVAYGSYQFGKSVPSVIHIKETKQLMDWDKVNSRVHDGSEAAIMIYGIKEVFSKQGEFTVLVVNESRDIVVGRSNFYPIGVGRINAIFPITEIVKNNNIRNDAYIKITDVDGTLVEFDRILFKIYPE